MIIVSIIKTEFFIRLVIPLFIICFMLLVLVPIIGVEIKGSKTMDRFLLF